MQIPSWLFYATVVVVGVAIIVVISGLHGGAMDSRQAQAQSNDLKEDVAEELVEMHSARADGEVASEVAREIKDERRQMDEEIEAGRRDVRATQATRRVGV